MTTRTSRRPRSLWPCTLVAAFAAATGLIGSGWSQDSPPAKPAAKTPTDLEILVQGNNQFAFDLYAKLAETEGNKFFSPYSISAALGMTYAGARGKTAKEMARVLHFSMDNERVHSAFGDLTRKVQGDDKKTNYQLSIANGLWGNKRDLYLAPEFLRMAQTEYRADFQLVDFVHDSEGARRNINRWIEHKTDRMVSELVRTGTIKENTRLILVNAITLKADWAAAFQVVATKPHAFRASDTVSFEVPMMNQTSFVRYSENAQFQLAQFMHKGDETSMIVVLPKNPNGLPQTERELSAKELERILASARPTELEVRLPKFRLAQDLELRWELEKLGIQDAFVEKIANFRGMESGINLKDSLYISNVIHQSFLDVGESGIRAAAGTGVIMSRPSSADIRPPVPFLADRPFMLFIRHNASRSILFMGRVSDPRSR